MPPAPLPPCGRPLRADAARNRERILTAARELFAARGLEVTLDDIARHAGLGTGTVYRRFADREALVEALFEERVDAKADLARRCLAVDDPWTGLVTFLHDTCRAMACDRGMRQVLVSSAYGVGRVAEARRRILPLVARLVERAQEAGALRRDFTPHDIPMLFLLIGTVTDFAGDEDPQAWERWFAVLLDGLRAGSATRDLPVGPLCQEQLTRAMSCWRPPARR